MNTKEDIIRLLDQYRSKYHIEGYWQSKQDLGKGYFWPAQFHVRVHLYKQGKVFQIAQSRVSDDASVEAVAYDAVFRQIRDYLNEPVTP